MSLPAFLENLDPAIFKSDNYLVLDFETDTSHGDHGSPVHPDNHLLLACWKIGPNGTKKAKWGSEFEMQELLSDIEKVDFIVAHNAKYELGWLNRCGIDLRKVLAFDTKLAEYVLLGNRASGGEGIPPMSTSLDMCCKRRGLPIKDPVVDELIKQGINPRRIPRAWLEARCWQDVETTEKVFKDQLALLVRTNRLAVQYTRCLLTPVLADIETEGMGLDPIRVHVEYIKAQAEYRDLETRMDAMTGGINWRSSKQVAEYVYGSLGFDELRNGRGEPKRTADDRPKTDQKTMDLLKATTPEQKEFLSIRKKLGKANALLTKSLEFFKGVCNEYDCKFYAELNQTGTATHRLSSTGIELTFETIRSDDDKPTKKKVQMHNTARSLKGLFCAKRKGWLMADPDGSQLEFRVAVELAGDEQGMIDIEDPFWDAHLVTAAAMEAKPYEEVLNAFMNGEKWAKDARQNAKPETFKPLYGGRKGSKKQERWYKEFRNRYKGIAAVQDYWIEEVLETKRLITPWGLRYYWPNAKATIQRGERYVNVTTAVCNYPVQALATAEIIPIALVYLWHRIGDEGLDDFIRIVNTIHDSAPTEVHPDHVDDFRRLSKQAFTTDVYGFLEKVYGLDFKVPLGVGLNVGTHLGEGTEEKWNIYKSGKEVKVK